MSYNRVLPRDAFNEANFLKCIGILNLYILEQSPPYFDCQFDGGSFDINQNESGDLYIKNLYFTVKDEKFGIIRPLNSRHAFPLVAIDPQTEEYIEIFKDCGNFTQEFIEFIGA